MCLCCSVAFSSPVSASQIFALKSAEPVAARVAVGSSTHDHTQPCRHTAQDSSSKAYMIRIRVMSRTPGGAWMCKALWCGAHDHTTPSRHTAELSSAQHGAAQNAVWAGNSCSGSQSAWPARVLVAVLPMLLALHSWQQACRGPPAMHAAQHLQECAALQLQQGALRRPVRTQDWDCARCFSTATRACLAHLVSQECPDPVPVCS
jgi:hypothetical protein